MARTNFVNNFDLCFDLPFSIVIRDHHIYKTIWTPVVGQELIANPMRGKKLWFIINFQLVCLSPKRKKTNEHK